MARPFKRGLDYFPLNVDFFDSEEIFCLGAELGSKAEFVALRLLTQIYRNGYYMEWNAISKSTLARKMELTAEFLDRVVSRLVEMGFFDRKTFEEASVLTSVRIQEVYFEATKRRNRREKDFPYLLIMLTKTGVNVDINPQSKVKESKGNKTLSSNDDDNDDKGKSTPTPNEKNLTAEDELAMMIDLVEADTAWAAEMAAFLNLGGPAAARELLRGEFRSHCIREGKTHTGLPDLKAHFNRWAGIHIAKSRTPLNGYQSKLPVKPLCGLKRRPEQAAMS
ncbi:MAG: DUF4373 domain-containing protein [Bacteroides sp.]|nr:DUF4373 domain-containing protein [Bacteroides sp.]